jgi:hypothetical protein
MDTPIRGRVSVNQGLCEIPGCDRDARVMKMCDGHYQRYKKGWRGAKLNAPLRSRVPVTGTCAVEGCDYPVKRSGLCEPHYQRKRKGLSVDDYVPRRWHQWDGCMVDDCDRPAHVKGCCGMHWQRFLRHGDPTKLLPVLTMEERFWSKIDTSGGYDACWPWLEFISPTGYARFSVTHDKSINAHRQAYIITHGDIADGLTVDHLCHNEARARGECDGGPACVHRRCVNPAHLEAITPGEQARRRVAAQAASARLRAEQGRQRA